VAPDRREDIHLSDTGFHIRDFDFRVLWSEIVTFSENPHMNELLGFYIQPWLHLRKIQIRLPRKNQRFCFDALHGFFKATIVRLLKGTVAALPGLQHCEHVLWVWRRYQLAPRDQETWKYLVKSPYRTFGARPRLPEAD